MIRHVACAISGGVDSAVAALLLKRKGYQVTGVFMRNWDISDETGHCSADKDCEDAQYVCNKLRIPFHEVNFVREYWNDVFCEMVRGYETGCTPNPDVLCNKHIKFGRLFDYVIGQLGADAIATGHYAQNGAGQFLTHLDNCKKGAKLFVSADQGKDQTLFLSQISQSALRRSMFPVGGYKKAAVKQIALGAGLEPIVQKKESAGICFIGRRCFQDFVEEYIEPRPGLFIDVETRQPVGEHRGVHYWTVGQRTLIGGLRKAYFVAARDASTHNIIVASGTDHPALFSDSMVTEQMHWIHEPLPGLHPSAIPSRSSADPPSIPCMFRFQHTHPLVGCDVRLQGDDSLNIHLDRPIRALTSGQYAVLYRENGECLGSAAIRHVGPSLWEQHASDQQSNQQTKHVSCS